MKKQEREKYRITIPDCIERIEEQTNGEIPRDAWFPVPSCSPVTHFVEAFTKRPQYELSIHFACGAGTYVFEDKETKKLVPITSFVDLKGLFEYLDEKSDELNSGANKYLVAAKFMTKLNSFIDKDKQPAGLNLSKLLVGALLRHAFTADRSGVESTLMAADAAQSTSNPSPAPKTPNTKGLFLQAQQRTG